MDVPSNHVNRTWDPVKVGEAINYLLATGEHVDPTNWLANQDNIALENEHGDLALFEFAFAGKKVYSGHYYFKSRGRKAIEASKAFLDELFNSCYNINVVLGLIPLENKAARWLTRRVGFTASGFEEIHGNEYELFILTKKEFNGG